MGEVARQASGRVWVRDPRTSSLEPKAVPFPRRSRERWVLGGQTHLRAEIHLRFSKGAVRGVRLAGWCWASRRAVSDNVTSLGLVQTSATSEPTQERKAEPKRGAAGSFPPRLQEAPCRAHAVAHAVGARGACQREEARPEPREWTRRPTLPRGVGGQGRRLPVLRVCPCVGTGSREGRGVSPSAPRPLTC